MASLLVRTTEFISLALITRNRGSNWPRQQFNRFVASGPKAAKHIWLLLSIFTGRIEITIGPERNWQLPGGRCRTNREFLFWRGTSIGDRDNGTNRWRK